MPTLVTISVKTGYERRLAAVLKNFNSINSGDDGEVIEIVKVEVAGKDYAAIPKATDE